MRRVVTEQREVLRHEVLKPALSSYLYRQARPVIAFQNNDKTSGAWLLSRPGPLTGLSNSVFYEAMAAHLCCPSQQWLPVVLLVNRSVDGRLRLTLLVMEFSNVLICQENHGVRGMTW